MGTLSAEMMHAAAAAAVNRTRNHLCQSGPVNRGNTRPALCCAFFLLLIKHKEWDFSDEPLRCVSERMSWHLCITET